MNTFEHSKNRNQEYLLTQVSNYIKQAHLRRLKRSGSLGLSVNSIRNLKRFYDLTTDFETYLGNPVMLDGIDHM